MNDAGCNDGDLVDVAWVCYPIVRRDVYMVQGSKKGVRVMLDTMEWHDQAQKVSSPPQPPMILPAYPSISGCIYLVLSVGGSVFGMSLCDCD